MIRAAEPMATTLTISGNATTEARGSPRRRRDHRDQHQASLTIPATSDADQLRQLLPVVGRRDELDMLHDSVTTGAGAVVAGHPGVGKSRLVSAFTQECSARGRRTMLLRATGSTRSVPFGVFAGQVREQDMGRSRLATYTSILHDLTGDGHEVCLVVEDVHHLDECSAALLFNIAQRPGSSVVVTVRSGEPYPDGVVALWKEGVLPLIELSPFSEDETDGLAQAVLGGPVTYGTRQRLWHLTGGNPRHLTEVVRAGLEQGVFVCTHGVWYWHGSLRARSARLDELVADRFGSRHDSERRLLQLLATAGSLPVPVIRTLGLIDACVDLEADGLLTVHPDDASAHTEAIVALAQPVNGEIMRVGLGELTMCRLFRELAEAARACGLHRKDPLRVATWCLHGEAERDEPDLWLAAASQALAGADWDAGGRMARVAEEAGAGTRAILMQTAALAAQHRWNEAHAVLRTRDGIHDGPPSVEVAVHAAHVEADRLVWVDGDTRGAQARLMSAAADIATPEERAALSAHAATIAAVGGHPVDAVRLGIQAARQAGQRDGARVNGLAAAGVGYALQGRVGDALDALEPVVARADTAPSDPYPLPAGLCGYIVALVCDGRIDTASSYVEERLSWGARHQSRERAGAGLLCRISLLQGRLDVARRWGCEAIHGLDPTDAQHPDVAGAAALATAAAQLGDVSGAEMALRWVDDAGPRDLSYRPAVDAARAWLLYASGEVSEARAVVRSAVSWAQDRQAWVLEMFGLVELCRLGVPAETAPRLRQLAERIEGSLAPACARYAKHLADGDGSGLRAAADEFEAMGLVLLAAEAAANASQTLYAEGRRSSALAAVRDARCLAGQTGGAVTPPLRDLDGDPAAVSLSNREREVVELAARGLTNAEIAARLYVSVRTVHSHLTHAYVKLGTNDRSELAAVIGLKARDASPGEIEFR